MKIPDGLKHLKGSLEAAPWFRNLPALLKEIAAEWDLTLGEPYERCHVSYTMPVGSPFGPTVLKLQWPRPECLMEADALIHWNGAGAIKLLAHDPKRHALLVERCEPGRAFTECETEDRIAVYLDLLRQLSVPTGAPFRTLREEAAEWQGYLLSRWEAAGRSRPEAHIHVALDLLEWLPDSQGEQVLLHQGLHPGNVLTASRAPFLAIDPKSLVGEREFALSPIINAFELGHSPEDKSAQLERLCDGLGLDRKRARGWAIVQALAWSFSTPFAAYRHDTARWLIEMSD
ncbi:aminoglycoside phosphotransferase family protein [Nisaea sp.]|uniref:aminoglycoside phosphotransferase family protein n=1 Tax=Nisaea sp. TaxID=2024842 RepID=UPI0032648F9A